MPVSLPPFLYNGRIHPQPQRRRVPPSTLLVCRTLLCFFFCVYSLPMLLLLPLLLPLLRTPDERTAALEVVVCRGGNVGVVVGQEGRGLGTQ